jgi:hypothetical protein
MRLYKYETLMLVTNGIGILALLSMMLAITSRKRYDLVQKERPFGDVARKVNLLWKVNNGDHIRQVSAYLEEIFRWEMVQIAAVSVFHSMVSTL